MKAQKNNGGQPLHPKWYPEAKVTCGGCGHTFTIGATVPEINIEVCSNCHPFYTGQMKYVDTAGRVEAFKSRMGKMAIKKLGKTEKRRQKKMKQLAEEMARPETLAQLRHA